MEFVNYLGDKNVVTFMLLLARMSGLIVFFPFFSHNSIPMIIKSTIVLFLTMYLYPLARLESLHLDSFFVLQLISEVIFGMIAGLMLQIIFAIIMMAGEQIAFTMGFTMASILDPSSGTSMPITSQILNLLALMFFLAFDGHHLMHYLNMGMFNIFIIGFTMSFPILGISLLADVIFGLLMKTMPQFNLLVIGYPIKIALGFVVLIAILLVMMQYFKNLILELFTHMQTLFFF